MENEIEQSIDLIGTDQLEWMSIEGKVGKPMIVTVVRHKPEPEAYRRAWQDYWQGRRRTEPSIVEDVL